MVDFMSQVRNIPLDNKNTLGDLFQAVFDHVTWSCCSQQINFIYASYLESSIKELERVRRAKFNTPIDYGHLTQKTLIPGQADSF